MKKQAYVGRGAVVGGALGAGIGALTSRNPYSQKDGKWKKLTKKEHTAKRVSHVLGGASLGAYGGAAIGEGLGTIKRHVNFHKGQASHYREQARMHQEDASDFKWKYQRAKSDSDFWRSNSEHWRAGSRDRSSPPPGGSYSSRSAPPPSSAPPPVNKPDWLKDVKTRADAKKAYRATAKAHHPDRGGDPNKMKEVNSDWAKWKGHFKEAMFSAFADELEKIARER